MYYAIREMREPEYPLLENFLYEAVFIPEGVEMPSRDIINRPELQAFIKDFGRNCHDICLVAEAEGRVVGAVWVRIAEQYGHIDNQTPSFAISLYKQYRKNGIGTAMMKAMLSLLRERGYKQASLSVQKENYAVKMYKSVGFDIIDETDEEYIMLCKFKPINRADLFLMESGF